ncbi:hypothetical protein F3Y22_tig00110321pilonHSYRG00027 [Hibiscus syriacus]|uniref:SCP domain-containing protein n=1 Tax=Hibiscus syriacus TaxID=106335 RepID=A0A6A3B3B7_HIBSY|nr:hypothetical protein F3Y22_tig00110321pilonHSYRG00027 [Hibiscus syriacus]
MTPQNTVRAAIDCDHWCVEREVGELRSTVCQPKRKDCALRHSNGPYGKISFGAVAMGGSRLRQWAVWVWRENGTITGRIHAPEGEECGQYTQIVWSRTKRVGCAKVVCDGGRGVFMICNYDPPGIILERPY